MFEKLIRLLIIGVTLGSCTKAAIPTVQALSSTLVQMKTSSASPFDQNFNSNKYAIFTGQCLNIITTLQISFNDGPWANVPTSAGSPLNGTNTINGVSYSYTETTTAPGSYDIDCSDGSFNFWIYEHQLDELIYASSGLTPGNSNVNKVAIRGVSGAYATEPTVFFSPYQKGPPAKISIQKAGARVGNSASQCAEFVIALRSSDDKFTNYPSDIPLSLTHTKNGISDSSFVLYSNSSDCMNTTTSAQILPNTLKISSNNSTTRVYYFVPAGATTGDNHSFAVSYANNPITLDASSAVANFTIKNGSSTYLEVLSPEKIISSSCYPIDLNIKFYNGSSPSVSSANISMTSAADLEIFPTSTCTSSIASFSFPGVSTKRLYVRLKPTATGSLGVINFTDSLASIDPGQAEFQYDLSGDTTIKEYRINGSNTISFGAVNSFFTAIQYNRYGSPVVSTGPVTIPLVLDNAMKGNFCNSGSCSGSVVSTNLAAFEYTAKIEYRPLLGSAVNISTNVVATGVINYGNTVIVNGGINKLGFVSLATSMTTSTCNAVQVQTQDLLGAPVSTFVALPLTISGPPASELYSDAICTTVLSVSPTIPVSTNGTTFYWKPLLINGTTRSLSVSTNVINPATASVTITP